MTAEKLYGILTFLDTLDTRLGLQKSLEAIGSALANLASAPAQPQHQNSLASALAAFESAVSQMRAAISPSQLTAIKAMGGEEFFDPSIAEKVTSKVQLSAMTPAVARDFVQELASRRSAFLSTVRNARQALEGLQLTETGLEAGAADVAFLIPRDIFENKLGPFAKELGFINHLLEHYSEAITGTAEPAEIEQLSSSVPTVALLASVAVISAIAAAVNKFLDAWEKIEKIRTIRADLKDMGLKGDALDQLSDQITTTVDQVVEESTELVIANYTGDAGRKNELKNAVRQDTRRLFGQIERGLTVEFRAKAGADDDETNDKKMLENIENLAGKMKVPEIAKEPMLLGSGEVHEGEILKATRARKTTTHRTTVAKKGAQKDGGEAEPKE